MCAEQVAQVQQSITVVSMNIWIQACCIGYVSLTDFVDELNLWDLLPKVMTVVEFQDLADEIQLIFASK